MTKISSTVLAVASLLFVPYQALAQQNTDWDQVKVEATPVAGPVYRITGQGGTMGIMVGDDGIVMIDSQYGELSDKILAEIRTISDEPIRFLINTHIHPDHHSGNANMQQKTQAAIISSADFHARKAAMHDEGIPVLTYTETTVLHMNGEDVQVIPLPPAHTGGDTVIYFPGPDVLFAGDVFRTTGFHSIDIGSGGSWAGSIEAFDFLIRLIGPNTKIVPGHGRVSTQQDLAAFRDMVETVGERVQAMVKEGRSLEEIMQANLTKDYEDTYPSPNGPGSPAGMVRAIYTELTGGS